MKDIFKNATEISTPLALGGLTAVIMFFVLRQLIKNNTFSALTKSSIANLNPNILSKKHEPTSNLNHANSKQSLEQHRVWSISQ